MTDKNTLSEYRQLNERDYEEILTTLIKELDSAIERQVVTSSKLKQLVRKLEKNENS